MIPLFARRDRDHPARHVPTPCAAACRGPREERIARRALRRLLGADAVLRSARPSAAIASGRVPVGNAAGDAIDSWLNPTSDLGRRAGGPDGAYLAAVWLAADAARAGKVDWSRTRSASGRSPAEWLPGALALAGLFVVRSDAPSASTTASPPARGWRACSRRRAAGAGHALLVVRASASRRRARRPRSPWPRSLPAGRWRRGRSCSPG